MSKLDTLRNELNAAREKLNAKGLHFDGNINDYKELMKIKPFEIAYQDAIEKVWPDSAWWQVTGYWDIFDAMMSGIDDKAIIDEICNHVGKDYLIESANDVVNGACVEYNHNIKEYMSKFGDAYDNGELWDFSKEDFENGAVDIRDDITYWYMRDLNGDWRYFETNIKCEKEEKKLDEGTSNFGRGPEHFPLLVFYTYDEFEYNVKHNPDYPQEDQFEDEDGNVDYDALEQAQYDFEEKAWEDEKVCVLDEDSVERLKDKLYDFNEESKRMAWDADVVDGEQQYGYNLNLEDVMLDIEPGYYEAAYINVEHEDYLDDLEDDFREQQIERFTKFFQELKEEFGLTPLGVAWGPASNGETGYKILNDDLKEEIKKPDREMIADMLKTGALDDINYVETLSDEEFEDLVDYWVDNYNTKEDHGELEEKKDKKVKVRFCGDPAKEAEFFNHTMGSDDASDNSSVSLGEDSSKPSLKPEARNHYKKHCCKEDTIKESFEEIYIKYWEDEDLRDQGISEIYTDNFATREEAIETARKLVDRDGFASVEVFVSPSGELESEDDKLIWGYDGIDTWGLGKDKDESLDESRGKGFVCKYKGYNIIDAGDRYVITNKNGLNVGESKFGIPVVKGIIDDFDDVDESLNEDDNIKYVVCTFEVLDDNSKDDEYSICIKATRVPTKVEAEKFLSKDIEKLNLGKCLEVEEVSAEEAHKDYDMEDEASFPIFDESLKESNEVARVEYCVMDKDNNNIECFDNTDDAIAFAKENEGIRVLEVQYGPKDEHGDEQELGTEEVWSIRESLDESDEPLKEAVKGYALVINGEWFNTYPTIIKAQEAEERFMDAVDNDEATRRSYGAFPTVEIVELHESLNEDNDDLYSLHVKVLDTHSGRPIKVDRIMVGSRKECMDKKKQLEETSPEDSYHNRNVYTVSKVK